MTSTNDTQYKEKGILAMAKVNELCMSAYGPSQDINAAWLHHTAEHLLHSLKSKTVIELDRALTEIKGTTSRGEAKDVICDKLVNEIMIMFAYIQNMTNEELRASTQKANDNNIYMRSVLQARYVLARFGQSIFDSITKLGIQPKEFLDQRLFQTPLKFVNVTEHDLISQLKDEHEDKMRSQLLRLHPMRDWERRCKSNLKRCRISSLRILFV